VCYVINEKRLGFDVSCLCCAVDGGVRLLKALELVGVDEVLCDRSFEQLELVRGWTYGCFETVAICFADAGDLELEIWSCK